MKAWHPFTRAEIEQRLERDLSRLPTSHRLRFEVMRVPLRRVPIAARPGEHVFVVAERGGWIVYWSDVEEGWELELPDQQGGIPDRGSNQFDLKHIAWRLFGPPDAQG